MADDRIDIQELIRRMVESARGSVAFSERMYDDEPIIQTGRQLQQRERQADRERRRDERARRTRARRDATAARLRAFDGPAQDLDLFGFERQSVPPASHSSFRFSSSRVVLTERLKELRELERAAPTAMAYPGSVPSASLFWRQAKLTEDYEDDFTYDGDFFQYYPTYATMSDRELRGYFSWRTKVRRGKVEEAPLTFAFVFTYELLMGIGTTPGEQGYADLRSFAEHYQEADSAHGARLHTYLRRWLSDYAIVHGLDRSLVQRTSGSELHKAVLTLLRSEDALLAREGRKRRVVWPGTEPVEAVPDADAMFAALCTVSRYHLDASRLTKEHRDDVSAVSRDVFARMVAHCSRRRKTDYVEGLFGFGSTESWAPYYGAVYFDPDPHPDASILVDETERYVCRNGRWRHDLLCAASETSKELGSVLHHVDFELRRQMEYRYPLKEKPVPKFVAKMVHDSVEAHLERKREEEARRITVDLSKLAEIRAAAATTREALLVDEERWDEERWDATQDFREQASPTVDRLIPEPSVDASQQAEKAIPAQPVDADTNGARSSAADSAPEQGSSPAEDLGLSSLELRVLVGLLDGKALSELLGPADPLPSVVIDRINEALFDELGDTAIDFDGVETQIVEDYIEDLKGLVGQ